MIHTGINQYFVDEKGNVLNKKTDTYVKWTYNKKNGYFSVKLSHGSVIHTKYVHRLVAFAYKADEYFSGADVNHKDGNKKNNNVENLEWCTRKENIRHSFANGLSNHKGSRNANSILTEDDVLKIKKSLSGGCTDLAVSILYGVSRDTIRSIRSGKNWSHL